MYDFDTTLDFPCSLKEYAINALQNEHNFVADFRRLAIFNEATSHLVHLKKYFEVRSQRETMK